MQHGSTFNKKLGCFALERRNILYTNTAYDFVAFCGEAHPSMDTKELHGFLPVSKYVFVENTCTRGSITVWLVSIKTRLGSVRSVQTRNNILPCLVESNPFKLETSCTVILPLEMSVLWFVCE